MQLYHHLSLAFLFGFIFVCMPAAFAEAKVPVLQATAKQHVPTGPSKPVLQRETVKNAPPAPGTSTSQQPLATTSKSPPSPKDVDKAARSQQAALIAPTAKHDTETDAPAGLPDISRQISSQSFMVMDAQTGAALYAKEPDTPRQPASTIKIITGLIALQALPGDDAVDVSRNAAAMPSSKIHLDPQQEYLANDLINAVLLSSANDASVALAEKISGSEDNFANLMTLSARMWGAKNTVCRTASGLTAEGQQSTSRDLATIFRYAMQDEEFVSRMRERTLSTAYGRPLNNHNRALWRIDGADAGKTGYTRAARQTYVGQFTRAGYSIVVAILGSETMWADLEKLVDYGFKVQEQRDNARSETTTSSLIRPAAIN
jgi:serine-type D-Ala-D-Ala carboxypeptidase (penicillin-binding protein 5/6)